MFVLGVFPFGADAFLEEVVVGFEGKFGGRSDVVLRGVVSGAMLRGLRGIGSYVDAPKLLHRVKGDDFFQEIIPVVVTLHHISVHQPIRNNDKAHLPARWLREPQRPLMHQRMLDVEVLRVMKNRNPIITILGF